MQELIDLRSDTVTRPTAEMREAMAQAIVGDDVYGEDPTVNQLEETAAALLGKEAALYVPTGVMGNTIALKLHTEHGQEIICDSRSHILNYELSMLAWYTGCVARAIPTADGVLRWDEIEKEYRPLGPHWAQTGLVEIENTHNIGGGTVYPIERIDEICARAHALGVPVHMDGARLFNAATASELPASRLVQNVDTVMFCLSKGLGAPAGSMVVGPSALIQKGRHHRKRLGGGMRQIGILAAAGLIALEKMTSRLSEDHAAAQFFATAVSQIPGISIEPAKVRTNIVIFDVSGTGITAAEFCSRLKSEQVLMSAFGPTVVRAVTHYDAPLSKVQIAVEKIKGILKSI